MPCDWWRMSYLLYWRQHLWGEKGVIRTHTHPRHFVLHLKERKLCQKLCQCKALVKASLKLLFIFPNLSPLTQNPGSQTTDWNKQRSQLAWSEPFTTVLQSSHNTHQEHETTCGEIVPHNPPTSNNAVTITLSIEPSSWTRHVPSFSNQAKSKNCCFN